MYHPGRNDQRRPAGVLQVVTRCPPLEPGARPLVTGTGEGNDAVAATERLNFEGGVFEISPLVSLNPGMVAAVLPREDASG